MTRLSMHRILLLTIIIANFYWVSSIFARSATDMPWSTIEDISMSSKTGQLVLQIKGKLNPEQLDDINIEQVEGSSNFRISMPKVLVDPEKQPQTVIELKDGSSVITVNIDEKIIEGEADEPVFVTDLMIKTDTKFKVETQKPITSSIMKIALKPIVEEPQKKEEVKKVAPKPVDIKEPTFEQKKEVAKTMAKESVEEILKHYHKPSIMQVSILNASGFQKRAYQLSVFLGTLKREYIEESLGMKMEIVNISNAQNMNHLHSTIYFRGNYLKSALLLAKLIKGDQKLVPMRSQQEKMGVDIEIYLGRDYK